MTKAYEMNLTQYSQQQDMTPCLFTEDVIKWGDIQNTHSPNTASGTGSFREAYLKLSFFPERSQTLRRHWL